MVSFWKAFAPDDAVRTQIIANVTRLIAGAQVTSRIELATVRRMDSSQPPIFALEQLARMSEGSAALSDLALTLRAVPAMWPIILRWPMHCSVRPQARASRWAKSAADCLALCVVDRQGRAGTGAARACLTGRGATRISPPCAAWRAARPCATSNISATARPPNYAANVAAAIAAVPKLDEGAVRSATRRWR